MGTKPKSCPRGFSRGGSRAGRRCFSKAPGEAKAAASQDLDGSPGPGSHHSEDVCVSPHTRQLGLSLWEEAEAEEIACSQLKEAELGVSGPLRHSSPRHAWTRKGFLCLMQDSQERPRQLQPQGGSEHCLLKSFQVSGCEHFPLWGSVPWVGSRSFSGLL